MTTASTEVSEVDSTARFPLSLLIAFAVLWLLVSGALAVANLIQTFSPSFLADCSVMTYGRVRGYAETTLVYGWVANSGFAVALWILGRLGGSPLRSLNWTVVGTFFWNVALVVGLVGIASGDGTSLPLLRMPRYVLPLLLVASGAISMPGVLAWTGRRHKVSFAAQWYAVAALFLFPWLFSAAQVMLGWLPVRGVLQAVASGWFVQGAYSLWIAPIALAAGYYLVPKVTGRLIPTYDFASLSFWTLLVVGPWTASRHLIDGPVPAWIATLAIVAAALLVFHYIVTALNLRGAFGGGGTVLRFVGFGVLAYVIGGFSDAVTTLRGVAQITQFTWVEAARTQLFLLGAYSMIIFGAIYFIVPRITNQPWLSTSLVRAHLASQIIGVLVLVAGLLVAGIIQGQGLADAALSFADVANRVRPWLLIATAGQALLLVGNLAVAVHFFRLVFAKPTEQASALLREPSAMEASVS
jgi:cytochrome c oxidase cbb3-type subunit 1